MTNISDINKLYDAYKASKKNSDWKPEVQRYEMNWATELSKLQKELDTKSYTTTKGSEFTLNERGKIRNIVGNHMRDRVVRHSFCDNELLPSIERYLIYDNGASRKKRGITFTRERLLKHLRNYYHHYGNSGYILLMDFSKYYDNIHHSKVSTMFSDKIDNMWLLDLILKDFEVDISDLNISINDKYDSLAQPKSTKGLLYMGKSVNIGDQTSQVIGIYYPTEIDNYIKIVRSMRYYGRYMDDSYILSNNKEELKDILIAIREIAKSLGIFINTNKTRIIKLKDGFRFLQNRYFLTTTGKIIIKINTKRLVAMRRKLKKLTKKIIQGKLPEYILEELFRSWYTNYYKLMTRKQRASIYKLYTELKGAILCINLH